MRNQWVDKDGFLLTAPSAGRTLKPGAYDICTAGGRTYVLKAKRVNTDDVVEVGGPAAPIIAEVADFWKRAEKFASLGVMHKRGYILHGPPGTGKTSTINIITSAFVAEGGVVFYGKQADLVTGAMNMLRETEPDRRVIVVLEDLDVVARRNYQGLIDLLDGQDSHGNVVYIATTNHLDRVDDTFKKRPSRFDRLIEIGPPGRATRKAYLESRKLNLAAADMERWLTASKGMTIAQLKELVVAVLAMDYDFAETVKRLREDVKDTPAEEEFDGGWVDAKPGLLFVATGAESL